MSPYKGDMNLPVNSGDKARASAVHPKRPLPTVRIVEHLSRQAEGGRVPAGLEIGTSLCSLSHSGWMPHALPASH